MKFTLSIFFLFIINQLSAQQKTEYYPDNKIKWTCKYKKGVRHGLYQEFWRSAKIKEVGLYEKGQRTGLWKTYYDNGKLEWAGNYEQGLKEGKWIKLNYSNTDTSAICYFSKDTLNGPYISYVANGKIESNFNYLNGKQHGLQICYHKNGNISYQATFENGYERDTIYHFHQNGQLSYFEPMVKSSWSEYWYKEGLILYYYESGTLKHEIPCKLNNHDGPTKSYYPEGELLSTGQYKYDDKYGVWTYYYPDGSVYMQGSYPDEKSVIQDVRSGKWIGYYPSGKLRWSGSFLPIAISESERYNILEYIDFEGNQIEPIENGTIFIRDIIKDTLGLDFNIENLISMKYLKGFKTQFDVRHGKWEWFDSTGTLKCSGNFHEGLADGTFTWQLANEEFAEGNYSLGERNGEWNIFYPDSSYKIKGQFLNDQKIGNWEYYDQDGTLIRIDSIHIDTRTYDVFMGKEKIRLAMEENFKTDLIQCIQNPNHFENIKYTHKMAEADLKGDPNAPADPSVHLQRIDEWRLRSKNLFEELSLLEFEKIVDFRFKADIRRSSVSIGEGRVKFQFKEKLVNCRFVASQRSGRLYLMDINQF